MVSPSPPLDDTRPQPQTTNNDNSPNNSPNPTANTNPKRKPSRRANTAERRATHNAVERARRETLNGRFLDLAQLLPNLCQIRRPSKSAIVNSSIAHISAARRHRLLAQRELRALKNEADALRRELNEWRDRAALPRIEEPQRGEGFTTVFNGELEVAVTPATEDDLEDGDDLYNDPSEGQNNTGPFYHEPEHISPPQSMFSAQAPPTPPVSSHGRPQHPPPISFNPIMHRGSISNNMSPPMIVSSNQVHFDPAHPANMHGMPQYAPHSPHGLQFPHHDQPHLLPEDAKAWPIGFSQRTNPSANAAPVSPFAHQPWHELLPGTGPASDISDSASASSGGGRARSGSMSTNGGGFGSPPRSPGSFELAAYDANSNYEVASTNPPTAGDFAVPRGLSINTAAGPSLGPMVTSPIAATAGGSGFGNVMMMGMM